MTKLSKYEECLKFLQQLGPCMDNKHVGVELKSIYYFYIGLLYQRLHDKQKALAYFTKS